MDTLDAKQIPLPQILKNHLCRLARFGANLADAHSCFVFLPLAVGGVSLSGDGGVESPAGSVKMVSLMGHHSLSNEIKHGCRIPSESGLIGWVAKHRRPIHVSPFEQDSRTLGSYLADEQLKSFIGIPIPLASTTRPASSDQLCGVLACDSKKSFAFSKLQGKLLEELALEIGSLVTLAVSAEHAPTKERPHWTEFISESERFIREVGGDHSELLRLRLSNFDELERTLGPGKTIALTEQVYRLIEQALPPHLPTFRLPQGDMIVIVDNMMTGFYENKIRAICQHVIVDGLQVSFLFWKRQLKELVSRNQTVEKTLREAMSLDDGALNLKQARKDEMNYEYRRA